jgi:hypothetical protein
VVLASLSKAGWIAVIGGYLLLLLAIFVAAPRDVNGRRRALGCISALAIFFGLFVVAFASWAADHIF